MLIDSNFLFAEAEDVFAVAGTNLAGVGKSLGGSQFRAGSNHGLKLAIMVTTAFAGAGTIDFRLVTDATTTIATDGSATHVIATGPLPLSALTKGTRFAIPIPSGMTYEEAIGLLVVGSGTTTAGAITAFLTMDAQDWAAFPDAVN